MIAIGETRDEASLRLQQGLMDYQIGGVKTNLSYLSALLSKAAFKQAQLGTDFIMQQGPFIDDKNHKLALI